MLSQTIQQSMPLLDMLPQPAFCVGEDGTVRANSAARHLSPEHAGDFPRWLAEGAGLFSRWDRTGTLELPLERAGERYSVAIRPLLDGLLVLMQPLSRDREAGAAMATASQVLRQPLTDLYSQIQFLTDKLEDPALLSQASAIHRQIFRLSRVAANLSDLELLYSEQYHLRVQRLDANAALCTLAQEVSDLLQASGRELKWTPLAKSFPIQADAALLQRAILNLLSNAIKFSPTGSPVALCAKSTDQYLLIQVENLCCDNDAALLRGAFDRLRQRDLLPDPRWGVGLGLPLAQAIARLHGGMVALEVRDGSVCVTLSVSRKRCGELPVLEAPAVSYSGGLRQTLLELSDVLPGRLYHRDAL